MSPPFLSHAACNTALLAHLMDCYTDLPKIRQRLCFFGSLHVTFRNSTLEPCLISKYMSIVTSIEWFTALFLVIPLYTMSDCIILILVDSDRDLIMFKILDGFKLVSASWFVISLDVSNPSKKRCFKQRIVWRCACGFLMGCQCEPYSWLFIVLADRNIRRLKSWGNFQWNESHLYHYKFC